MHAPGLGGGVVGGLQLVAGRATVSRLFRIAYRVGGRSDGACSAILQNRALGRHNARTWRFALHGRRGRTTARSSTPCRTPSVRRRPARRGHRPSTSIVAAGSDGGGRRPFVSHPRLTPPSDPYGVWGCGLRVGVGRRRNQPRPAEPRGFAVVRPGYTANGLSGAGVWFGRGRVRRRRAKAIRYPPTPTAVV